MHQYTMLSIITGIMRHNPRRHGVMQAPSTGPKYIESPHPPTPAQIAAHLAGTLTLAAPATTDGQASAIVYDIDSQAWEAIPALLMAAEQRGSRKVRVVNHYLTTGEAVDVPASARYEPARLQKYEQALQGSRLVHHWPLTAKSKSYIISYGPAAARCRAEKTGQTQDQRRRMPVY